MIKAPYTILFSIIISSALSHGMEQLIPLKSAHAHDQFKISCIQDIPKLSLKNIRPCFNTLPEKKRNEILKIKNKSGVTLEQALTFNLALLEEETVRIHILTYMMDGDEISAKMFYKVPLLYAYKEYHKARSVLQRSLLIKQPIALLFRLPVNEQKEIMGIVTPTITSQITNDSIIYVSEENEKKVQSYNPEIKEQFFANENIKVISKNLENNLANNIMYGIYSMSLMGTIIGTLIIAVTGLFPYLFLPHCFDSNFTTYDSTKECIDHDILILSAVTVPSCIVLANIIGYIVFKRYIKQQAQLINI